MVQRLLALVPDEEARAQIDLLRALYDRDRVDRAPPCIPLTEPLADHYGLDDLQPLLEIILGLHHPFLLALGAPQPWYDDGEHLLQMEAERGGEEAQRIAAGIYRDLFPEQTPNALIRSRSPLARTALTLGRFRREAEAAAAAAALAAQRYFLVVTHVGIFDLTEAGGEDAGAPALHLRRSLPLGGMLADAAL